MRLTLLADSPSKRAHGNAASRLALGLAQTGEAEPAILCYGDDPRPSWLPADVPVDRLGVNRASRAILPLARYLGSHQPDVLITRQIHTNLCALPAAGLARYLYGWRGKLVLVQDHPIALSHAADWRDNKWLSKIGYRFADGVIAPSPDVGDDIIRWCNLAPESVALVPNAIPPFSGLLATPPHPWLREGEPPVFVHISNLSPWKRLDLLVEAFAELSRTEEVRLLIVGQGPGRAPADEQIRRLGIAARAESVGWVDDPLQYAARACALVHPSDEEGFGQVLTEAMSAGCPVITTDAQGGGPRYITRDGDFGILVPRGDTPALTAAMRRALQPEVRARYSRLGLERSEAFAPVICADTLIQFLVNSSASGNDLPP
jgi:glycosyltransferase involved in cell wall biosynthesis